MRRGVKSFLGRGRLEHSLETHVGVGGNLHSVSVRTENSQTGHDLKCYNELSVSADILLQELLILCLRDSKFDLIFGLNDWLGLEIFSL